MAKPREKFKTYGDVFDNFTNRLLFKLSCQGHFEEDTLSPISIGKEANVFSAKTKDGGYIILKIYRLETCDFTRMYEFIRTDPRFEHISRKRRNVIFMWAQREYRNLMKAREVIRVPTPITFEKNILILELIGDDAAALKLKDTDLEDPEETYDKVAEGMKRLHEGGFVHGDLSEFNILMWGDDPIFIDFSQAMPLGMLHAEEFLLRDIKNICRFFKKRGVERSEDDLYEYITGKKRQKA